MRVLILVTIALSIAGCSKSGCRKFSSEETSFCIPRENALGSLWFLGRVSKNEVGFELDSAVKDGRVTVTLTRRDYLCKIANESEKEIYCRPSVAVSPTEQTSRNIVKQYADGYESVWTYQIQGAANQRPLANCSAIPDVPNAGRCITSGEYKDIVYSAIYRDSRPGGVLRVLADVETQIRLWEVH